MPADCEIDSCGVIAVGRCSTCGRAMCTSHRAMQKIPGGFRTMVDLCEPCAAPSDEDIRKANELAERPARARARIQELVNRLATRGVSQSKFLHATRREQGLFRDREVEDPGGHRFGWYVGEFMWALPDNRPHSGGGSVDVKVRTYVTNNARVASQEIGEWQDDAFKGPSALVGAWTSSPTAKAAFWESVADALEEIATRSGA